MTEDKRPKEIRGYVSEYLRQPLRTLTEAQQERAQQQSETPAVERVPELKP